MSDDHEAWIRQVVNLDDRHDKVPSLNGVEGGQTWRNVHTGWVENVVEIWLAGTGVYSGHSEGVVLDSDERMGSVHPLYSLQEHWELVRRRKQPNVDTVIVDDGSGQLGIDVETDEWERVEPQPYVWHGRDGREERRWNEYRSEDAWVSRVVHCRPQGAYVEWEGRNSVWRLYGNKVLTRDGLVVSKHTGYPDDRIHDAILKEWPDAAPVETTR